MRFSIVTPVYNAERYLGRMLDSVRHQSLYDWELRIVDDGSTDGTKAIIEAAATDDPRIKPLYLDENSGSCFFPRRVAIERSEGDYIVNIDADDYVERDYLYNLESRIRETGADLVYADMFLFKDGEKPQKFIISEEEDIYHEIFNGQSIFKKSIDKWEVTGVAATARQLSLLSLQLFDFEFSLDRYCGTFENENLTRLDLYLAERVAFAHAAYFYRQNPDSVTHKLSFSKFELLESDENLCRFAAKYYGQDSMEYKYANRQFFHHIIEFIRLLNTNPSFPQRKEAVALTKHALKRVDFKSVRELVSPRYFSIMQMGYHFTKKVLGVYEGKA